MEEKILTEVKKKVKQAERALRPTLENATLASNTVAQTEDTANTVAKVSSETTVAQELDNFLKEQCPCLT